MTDQQSNVTLRYSIDEQALANLFSRSNDLITNLESISNANDEIARSAQASFSGMADAIGITDAEIKQLNETFAELNGDISSNISAVIPKIDEVNASEVQVSDTLKVQLNYMNQLIEADQARITKAQEYADYVASNERYAIGYGKPGGMIGPAEDTGDEGGTFGGGGRGGNLSAVGRAFMTGGKEFHSTGLSAVGSSLYEAQGASQLMKLTEGIGESVQVAIPALEGLSAGVVGLSTVAIVAAPLVLVGVAALSSLNDTMKEVNQAAQDATKENKDYSAVLMNSDYQKARTDLQQQQQKETAALVAQGQASQEVVSAHQQLTTMFSQYGFVGAAAGQAIAGITENTGLYGSVLTDAKKAVDDNAKAYHDAADAAAADTKALAFFTDIKTIEDASKFEEERFKLIQQGSAESVTQQMEANAVTQKINQEAIDALEAKLHTTADPQQQEVLNKQIQDYINKNIDLGNEYQYLDTQVLAVVYALEQQRHETELAIAGIDQSNAWEVKRAQLIKTGTEQQIKDQEAANLVQQEANKNSIASLQNILAHTTDQTEITKISAKIADYNNKNAELAVEYADLTKNIEPVVAATAQFKVSSQEVKSAIEDMWKATQDFAKLTKTANDAQAAADETFYAQANNAAVVYNTKRGVEIANNNDKLADEDKKQAEKKAGEIAKLDQAYLAAQQKTDDEVLKLQTERTNKETTIATNLSEKITTITADLGKKIADIQDKARYDEIEAAASLDSRRIAQLQRKEAQDIKTATDTAKTQEDTATKTADKEKATLEKDTAFKIDQLEKQGKASRDLAFQQGLQKVADEQDQYDTERKVKVADFEQRLKDEDAHEKELNTQRYDAWQAKKKDIQDHYDEEKAIIVRRLADDKTALDDGLKPFVNSFTTFFDNLKGTQTTKQADIETSWRDMLDRINAMTSSSQPSTPTAPFTSSSSSSYSIPDTGQTAYNGISNTTSNLALQNYANNYANLAGYTGNPGDLSLAVGGQLDTALNLSSDNKANNYSNFAGYRPPGYASGGLTDANQSFIAGDGGGPELVRMRQPGQVFNAQDTANMLGGKGGIHIGTLVGKMEINGANLSPEQIGDIATARLISELKKVIDE